MSPRSRKQITKAATTDEKQDTQWEELGKLLCSLKPEDFDLINRPKVEISSELTRDNVVSNVLSFVNFIKNDVGNAADRTIFSKTIELTAKLCNVDKNVVASVDQKAQRKREILNDVVPGEKEQEERVRKTRHIITKREKEILQDDWQDLHERRMRRSDLEQRNDKRNQEDISVSNQTRNNYQKCVDAPGNSLNKLRGTFLATSVKAFKKKSSNTSLGRKRKMQDPINNEEEMVSRETMIQVTQNPFWKRDIGLGEADKDLDRASKISRAIAEEAEKKIKREEDARKKKEKRWTQLGEAICNLSLDDFILSPESAEAREELDYNPPINMRGEQILTAVATFVHSLKGLIGEKLTHNTIIKDQNDLSSALCGITYSAMSTRFSFKRKSNF